MSQGRWSLNSVKRDGGHFLWRQIVHALNGGSIRTVYGATWDEYVEHNSAQYSQHLFQDMMRALPYYQLFQKQTNSLLYLDFGF